VDVRVGELTLPASRPKPVSPLELDGSRRLVVRDRLTRPLAGAWVVARAPATVWTEEMTSQLIAMRRDGLRNEAIAEELEVPLRLVSTQVGKLIRDGVLSSRRGLLWSHADSWAEGRERTQEDVAPAVARLYRADKSYREIAAELDLTPGQVHNILTRLFAGGLARRPPHALSDEQALAIHAAYLAGGKINQLAAAIGFSGSAVRDRLRSLGVLTSSSPS
jgi:hypothetical protein